MNLQQQWLKVLGGAEASFRPQGNSMKGLIASGSLVKVVPCKTSELAKDDIVLVKVKGNVYLHKILALKNDRFLIGNNKGGVNGWASAHNIGGLCVEIDGKARAGVASKLL